MRFVPATIAAALLLGQAAPADPPGDEVPITALIEQLDDDDFHVRQRATTLLSLAGEAAVAPLSDTLKDGSPEQRTRAAAALRLIQTRRMGKAFRKLGEQDEKELGVEQGMVLIAQILDPEVTAESIATRLDQMAGAVRKAAGQGIGIETLDGTELVDLIVDVLGTELGFEVDEETYDHPDNSSIHRVLEQKDGLPIMLSEIAVAIGRRLEIPIAGVAVPRNYMFKYDGSQAPEGLPKEDVIVDTRAGWKVKSADLISQRWGFAPQDLEPSKPRATIERMLNNLESDFEAVGQHRRAAEVRSYRAIFLAPAPRSPAADQDR